MGIVALDMNFPNSTALPPGTTNILLIVPYSRLLEKMEKGTGGGRGGERETKSMMYICVNLIIIIRSYTTGEESTTR
jgi:hypothetical protein